MVETGREEAEDQLARTLESFRPDLLRFSFWLSRDRTVAEDVTQETLLRAWRARGELRQLGSVRPWLLTIARREYARLHERKSFPTIDIDECLARQDPELSLHDTDPEINDLRRAILGLAEEYREPLVLGGLSTGEIAAELGLSVPAVLTRLFRARNKLRELYGVTRGDDTAAESVP